MLQSGLVTVTHLGLGSCFLHLRAGFQLCNRHWMSMKVVTLQHQSMFPALHRHLEVLTKSPLHYAQPTHCWPALHDCPAVGYTVSYDTVCIMLHPAMSHFIACLIAHGCCWTSWCLLV